MHDTVGVLDAVDVMDTVGVLDAVDVFDAVGATGRSPLRGYARGPAKKSLPFIDIK